MAKIKRVFIVGPTRSIGKSLLRTMKSNNLPQTVLRLKCGAQLDAAYARLSQDGLGMIAVTGAGKSLEIRQMCLQIFPEGLRVGIINLERERNKYTDSCNVVVITPGIALILAANGTITRDDLVVFDEVHQTSVHLELAMAILKSIGCAFVWASATVDPDIYRSYLGTKTVVECTAYSSKRRADVSYQPHLDANRYLSENIQDIAKRQRGVAVFVATQADAEMLAREYNGQHGVFVDYYHGGASIDNLDRFIHGPNPRPFVIAMTPAGASGLNLVNLNTVVIVDRMYGEVIRDGKSVNELTPLSAGMLKQMLGRVEGRAIDGEAVILTDNPDLNVRALRPETPNFLLGGDLEALALISAKIGVDARKLSLIGNPDLSQYDAVLQRLVTRGLIIFIGGKPQLTPLGKRIERMPISAAWGEVIDRAQTDNVKVDGWLQAVCLTASIERLYAVTRKATWQKDSDELVVKGSDHLTAYNIVASALRQFGVKTGRYKYSLGGKEFKSWCKSAGYGQRGIYSAVQQYVSLVRRLNIELPDPETFVIIKVDDELHICFLGLLASVQSMDYVPRPPQGVPVTHANKNGVTDGISILGTLRYWNTDKGIRRASIDGTHIPEGLAKQYAREVFTRIVEPIGPGRYVVEYDLRFAGHHVGETRHVIAEADLPTNRR